MTETIIEKDMIEETEIEKPYKFRKLRADDIPFMLRIVKKIGLREFKDLLSGDFAKEIIDKYAKKYIKKMLSEETKEEVKEETKEEVNISDIIIPGVMSAFDIVEIVLENIVKIDDDLFKLLARVSTNLDEKGVRNLDMDVFAEMLIDFFKKEEFPDFFKVVSKLFK